MTPTVRHGSETTTISIRDTVKNTKEIKGYIPLGLQIDPSNFGEDRFCLAFSKNELLSLVLKLQN